MKTLLVTTSLLAWTATAASAAPDRMGFTGRLSDEAGPLSGSVSLSFAIFDARTGGTMVWEEAHPSVDADDGLVFVELGSTASNGLDADVFAGDAAFLEVTVNGETLAPRTALLSVPYAASAARAEIADSAELLGTLAPDDVARASHTHGAADISGALGAEQIDCYADLLADGHLNGDAATDLLTRAQSDARFLGATEAYGDLADSGRLDGNAASDLVTRVFGDGRFLNVGEVHNHSAAQINAGTLSTDRYDAYSDLVAANRLNNDSGTDLPTRNQADARYLRSGDGAARFYGCGTYALANFCPAGNTQIGPNCDDVPAGSYCEADGECGLSTVGNCGTGAWYFKRTE